MPATRLERRSRTARSNRTPGYIAHFRKNHLRLLLGNGNVLIFTGKELELVEEAKKNHRDIVGVSSTKRRGSGIADLDGGLKLVYSGADPSICPSGCGNSHKTSVVRLCVQLDSFRTTAYMLKLIVKDRSLCLLQVYTPNAVGKYQVFVDDVNDAFQRVRSTEFKIFLVDFNAHIGTDCETWKGVIGRHGDPAFNENGRYLLELCCSNGICIMNTFFQHRNVQ